jgi:hypothetical protein
MTTRTGLKTYTLKVTNKRAGVDVAMSTLAGSEGEATENFQAMGVLLDAQLTRMWEAGLLKVTEVKP